MRMDKLWEIANTISAIAGLLISAILVMRFYIPYVIKRSAAVITGMTFFVIMTILYFIPISMSGVAAYVIGITALCLASLISERENIPQKIFLSLTIYMFLWISHSITVLPWKLISGITYMNVTDNEWLQFALFVVALILYVGIENALLFLQIYITEKIFLRKNEQMEWLEMTLLASPYIAIIAGYWISTFTADAYESISGQYIWNNYPVYDGIRTLFGVIAFFAVMTVMHSYQQVKKVRE